MTIRGVRGLGVLLFPLLTCFVLGTVHARELSFEDRVRAQEAIERVYYSHQLGASMPFEEAMPQELLEQKVKLYLKQSVLLDQRWDAPVSAESLAAELERQARDTKLPDRLVEIYNALGRDSFLVAECFARPVIVDRLARNFFAFDAEVHGSTRQVAEELRAWLVAGTEIGSFTELHDIGIRSVPRASIGAATDRAGPADAERHSLKGDLRKSMDAWQPAASRSSGRVEEEREAFIVRGPEAQVDVESEEVTYVVPKVGWDAWWAEVEGGVEHGLAVAVARESQVLPTPLHSAPNTAALADSAGPGAESSTSSPCVADDTWLEGRLDGALPLARTEHSSVWTGTEMLVWGGWTAQAFADSGGRYDPLTDYWRATSLIGTPAPRYHHIAIWTGSRMFIWGGYNSAGYLGDGALYDPIANTWEAVSQVGAPSPRYLHAGVWTGSQALIWGGYGASSYLGSGGKYDPASDTWSTIASTAAPEARYLHTAVWTDDTMVVWGGYGTAGPMDSGGRYDPAADSWAPTASTAAPEPRYRHAAVWTGAEMVIWGGIGDSGQLSSGSRYDPAADAWSPTSLVGAPQRRSYHTAVWSGSKVVVWGGSSDLAPYTLASGGLYDPATDSWSGLAEFNPPRYHHTAEWTGSLMLVWGGRASTDSLLNTGGRYNVAANSWTPTSIAAQMSRARHSTVWTGNHMIVWGGQEGNPAGSNEGNTFRNSGARYDPLTDHWAPIAIGNAPSARIDHTAVWTGHLMVVWGGAGKISGSSSEAESKNSGGRYNPLADSWTLTSLTNAPQPVTRHTAVWTGSVMIVWGGGYVASGGGSGGLPFGSRYDPVADTWMPTSLTGGYPDGRCFHTAVWTGDEMIVWGGSNSCSTFFSSGMATGGKYDPLSDTWLPTSPDGAPGSRKGATAIWSGTRMILWGGYSPSGPPSSDTGATYDPSTDAWEPMSTTNAPSLYRHTAIWTGSRMVVWGGLTGGNGGEYNPTTDAWTSTSIVLAPQPRHYHSAVWTGGHMIVWGGGAGDETIFTRNDGGRYGIDDSPNADADEFTICAGDCNDGDGSVFPGAAQSCDGLNNDCDHPGWPSTAGTNDGDNDGDTLSSCQGDCADDDASVYSGAPQVCDGLNNDCSDPSWPALSDTTETDDDLDALSECQGDCDDADNSTYAGAPQVCDGVNNNCQDPGWPAVAANESDPDQDGFPACAGDCDDGLPSIYPGAPQLCDGVNNDCAEPGWPVVPAGESDSDLDGFLICGGDCNDAELATYPGAPQICDGVNSDCSDPAWPAPPAGEADGDQDGVRVCEGDCNDSSSLVWATPGEVRELALFHDARTGITQLSWDAPAEPGGQFLIYDTIRSGTPSNFVNAATCVETNDGLNTTSSDGTVPPSGGFFSYLVRAENSCPQSAGSLGTDSSGNARSGRSCP